MQLDPIPPGTAPTLDDAAAEAPRDTQDKKALREELADLGEEMAELQEALYAESRRALLVVLQGRDTGGKYGAIRHVFGSVNPMGVEVTSFKAPTPAELSHDYLWRVHQRVPGRGMMGVFNRSHYEDVVAARIVGVIDDDECAKRYGHIRDFERMLVDEGTTVVKVFLHISREEQRARLQARLDDPTKRWKFRPSDLDVRTRWDEYQRLYERAVTETSTDWAPWWVVPANHKWVRNVVIASLLVETLRRMDPEFPPEDPALDGIVVE